MKDVLPKTMRSTAVRCLQPCMHAGHATMHHALSSAACGVQEKKRLRFQLPPPPKKESKRTKNKMRTLIVPCSSHQQHLQPNMKYPPNVTRTVRQVHPHGKREITVCIYRACMHVCLYHHTGYAVAPNHGIPGAMHRELR